MKELFQELGLSKNEAKLYEVLIHYGGSGVSTLALRAKIHRRNAYDAIQRLIDKGLAYEVFGGKEVIYQGVDPSKLLEIVREKESKLEKVMPDLLDAYMKHVQPQKAYIYKGLAGIKNYLKEALDSGEDIYSFGAKGAWFHPKISTFTEWFLKEAKAKKMKFHHIFDHEVKKEFSDLPKLVGGKSKFLPKKFSTNSTIDIFGDHVVTFTGLKLKKPADDVVIFVMVSRDLADSYRAWWKMQWELID
jgi:sugar-specific transcriptional regulator TrmB